MKSKAWMVTRLFHIKENDEKKDFISSITFNGSYGNG